MKLYLIERPDAWDYDEYDSAVVAAESSEEARMIRPDGAKWDGKTRRWDSWVDADEVIVTYLGKAIDPKYTGVVCSSFNAG